MDRKSIITETMQDLPFKLPYTAEEWQDGLYFENYHCHKDFSNAIIADSGESIESYARRTKELGGKCLFSGEHGSQGNQFHVYTVAEREGLKYRHSAEAYWVKNRLEKDRTNCHIMLIAKNAEGRRDINYALSVANIDGYYYRPRIDLELLKAIPSGNVIVTTACIAGWLYEDAESVWCEIAEHFKDNFYFEVQYHNTDSQKKLNERILRLSEKYGIPIIAGLDSHYINDTGRQKRDEILKYKHITYPDEEGWYMDYPDGETVINRFREQGVLSERQIISALMMTNLFTADCEDIVFEKSFKIPSVYKDKTYEEKCGIYKALINKAYAKETLKSKAKADGIRYEAKQVMDSGVVDYFLTSQKIVENAVTEEGGILTTTSRGSAASFVTNKLLGLTTVDRFNSEIPIYPERFLTKERVVAGMMPDIDLNIAEQEPFVRAAKKLLGEHGCYPLMAVEKLKAKNAWQIYAGTHDVPPQTATAVSKAIEAYELDLAGAEDDEKDTVLPEKYIPSEYLELFKESREYRNIMINLKVHACGHLIFDGDIRREIGLISAVSKTTGKRTVCACVEGGVLDDFGFVKEDFLIVDSVSLTHKCFKSVGEKVPTFDKLKELIKDDEKTWEIYEKGITCCVNQCEREATVNKLKKYKPKNIAELSAFIAAIRPGFSSLLHTFLNRDEYSTGENSIDELLKDTSHFMLYQESIMKILSFLGIDMGETYGVIKSISKKKLKGEKKRKLLKELQIGWQEQFGNTDNFDKVWNVIEDSAAYSFNAPHAYSMAGDSAYLAWFKAHHTSEFYETAINHYQTKGNKDKISALINEAAKFYGYKIGRFRFGDDNRCCRVAEKTIFPNMSSVKGLGEAAVEDLYKAGQRNYASFAEIIDAISETKVNKTQLQNLIRIGYFDGEPNELLEAFKWRERLRGRKTMKKTQAEEYGISGELMRKYGCETEKLYTKLDSDGLYRELTQRTECKPMSLSEILIAQDDVLGRVTVVDPNISKQLYFVLETEEKKSVTEALLYEIYSGTTRAVKLWTSDYGAARFEKHDFLNIARVEKRRKREWNGTTDPKTGRCIYVPVPDKYEYWLKQYTITKGCDKYA